MQHSHPPEPDRQSVDKFRKILTQRAQKERTELYTIYWEEATQRHSDAAMIYSFTQAESCMRKARRKQPPQSCTTIRELSDILGASSLFSVTCGADKENLYKMTIIHDDGTCLVFMHYKTLEKIGRIEEMHVDHSIRSEPSAPNFNFTILTIHTVQQKMSYPFAYIVMTVKSQALYEAIFSHLRENLTNICPTNIFSNYDPDLMEALKQVFPETTVRGYYYHYTTAVLNKMKLLKIAKQKGHVTSAVRMLLVLPLLPANYMRTGLQSIRKWLTEKKAISPQFEFLCDFIENQWLLKIGAEKMSIFSLPHCVTNHIQMFNTELQSTLGISNPMIWHMLEAITHVARQTFIKLTKRSKQLPASVNKAPKKGELIQDTIIKSATSNWIRTPVHLRNSLQFLQVTSHCINDALFAGVEEAKLNASSNCTLSTSPVESPPSLTYTVQTMNSTQLMTASVPSPASSPISPQQVQSGATTIQTTSFRTIPTTTSIASTTSEPPPLAYYRKAFLRENVINSEPPPLIFFKDIPAASKPT